VVVWKGIVPVSQTHHIQNVVWNWLTIIDRKQILTNNIEEDTAIWFKFFGIENKLWKKYGVDIKDASQKGITNFF
jgi:hypothetical protein